MAITDRLRGYAGRVAGRAGRALSSFGASATPLPVLPRDQGPGGVSGMGFGYPRPAVEDPALSSQGALESRIATRAGPVPTRITTAGPLDPLYIDRVFKNATLGIGIYQYADLTKKMRETDAHLMGIDRQRRQGVANKDLLIYPRSDTDALMVGMAHAMRSVVDQIDALPAAIYSSLSSNCDGWSISEIIWRAGRLRFQLPDGFGGGPIISVDGLWPRAIEWVHPKHTTFDFDSDEPLLELGLGNPVRLPRHKFIYSLAPGEGIASARGYARSVVWMHFFKHATIKDWNSFLHMYGLPMLRGTIKRGMWKDEDLKNVLELALQAYGRGDSAPILPDDCEIDVKQPVSLASGDAWFRMSGFCNAEQSKAVLGETLTTEAGESGSYKLGDVHQDSAHDVIVGDALGKASDLRADLFASVIDLNREALAQALNVRPDELDHANPLCLFQLDRDWTPAVRMKMFADAAEMGISPSETQIRREMQLDRPISAADAVKGKPFAIPAGAAAVGSTDASQGVDNPKPDSQE